MEQLSLPNIPDPAPLTQPATSPPPAWSPVLGPADRASFFDEQRRNRRSTWRLSAMAGLVVLALSVAVSILLTPAFIAELGLLIYLLDFVGIFDLIRPLLLPVAWLLEGWLWVMDRLSGGLSESAQFAVRLAVFVLPGTLLCLAAWWRLAQLFHRSGVGGVLFSLGARDPRPDDPEEQQLVNIAQELGIAAGIQPPRVMLLDAPVANAAVIGSGPDSATVIVSRQLLDELDRDETQGVLAHLVGSAGNGDLGIALTIIAVVQMFGLLLAVVEAPVSRAARRTLWKLLRFSLRPGRAMSSEAREAGDLMVHMLSAEGIDDSIMVSMLTKSNGRFGRLRAFLLAVSIFILLPLLFLGFIARFFLWMMMSFLLGPLLALTWRSRRYLADATAVQLTRNPDGLALALIQLAGWGAVIPGTQSVAHLFIIGPEAGQVRTQARKARRLIALRRQQEPVVSPSSGDDWGRLGAAYNAAVAQADKGTVNDQLGIVVSFHPSLKRRLARLARQGATVSLQG